LLQQTISAPTSQTGDIVWMTGLTDRC